MFQEPKKELKWTDNNRNSLPSNWSPISFCM